MSDHTADSAAADAAAATRRERTAARLRDAARDAFAEHGWHATRVEDIVRRAGVSHGTFYTYYDNRAAVLADLVHESQAEVLALGTAPWEGDDVRRALERVIGGFLDLYDRDAAVFRTWLEATREEQQFTDLYLSSRDQFIRRVGSNLAAAAGGRAGPPPLTVASSLVAMVEHFAYCWLILGEPHDRQDAVDSLVLVWGAALNALAGRELVPGID